MVFRDGGLILLHDSPGFWVYTSFRRSLARASSSGNVTVVVSLLLILSKNYFARVPLSSDTWQPTTHKLMHWPSAQTEHWSTCCQCMSHWTTRAGTKYYHSWRRLTTLWNTKWQVIALSSSSALIHRTTRWTLSFLLLVRTICLSARCVSRKRGLATCTLTHISCARLT